MGGAHGSGALVERLAARRDEIEQTLLTRVYAVSDPGGVSDPEYALGLREAVAVALDYGLAALEGEARAGSPPHTLLEQARKAARNRVSLDTVLRRYVAGHALLDDFILQEVDSAGGIHRSQVQRAMRSQALLLDRLIAIVSTHYQEEVESGARSRHQRRARFATMLLEGELVDGEALDYDLGLWHLGVVASGSKAERSVAKLVDLVDCRPLIVRPAEGVVWAWLGSSRRIDPEAIGRLASPLSPGDVRLAIGEPGRGLNGWRITHRQALAALAVAARGGQRVVSYPDVCLLASILRDDLLVRSLHDLYIAPLTEERDGGESLQRTLRAYFAADRNTVSASATLGVARQTVNNRLRTVEERLNRPLASCATELEAALRVHEIASE